MTLPAKHSREGFLRMIEEEIGKDKVDEAMLKIHAKKINFNLRIAEIVRQMSCNSNLVVMTLPVPKKEYLPPALYMSILEYTTRDMPPFLYVRGNQESVLTFYSWTFPNMFLITLKLIYDGERTSLKKHYLTFNIRISMAQLF
jgi:solute carrier family 12 sodium/potassium/chloride transporter 2